MSKMIQIRHVPDEIHQKLRAKALRANMALSDFLLREIRILAELPSWDEAFERIGARKPAGLRGSTANLVRRERDTR